MKPTKIILTGLLIALSIISCKKDENQNPQPQQPYTPPPTPTPTRMVTFTVTLSGQSAFATITYTKPNGESESETITASQTFSYTGAYEEGKTVFISSMAECSPLFTVSTTVKISVDNVTKSQKTSTEIQYAYASANHTI